MSRSMDGRVVIVTGATSGIGEATARLFASKGAAVIVAGRRAERGRQIAAEIEQKGDLAHFVRADMTSPDDIENMVRHALDTWGRLDFAFNNAGVFGPEAPFHEYDEEIWNSWIATNLSGVFHCMKHELAAMRATSATSGHGAVIVNNASTMAHRGSLYAGPAYAASKHGVMGLTRQAAIQYAPENIRVNAVSPGPTVTDITAGTHKGPNDILQQVIKDLLPVGRMAMAAEVAEAVYYLCSPAARMITGQDIVLDGGQLAKL